MNETEKRQKERGVALRNEQNGKERKEGVAFLVLFGPRLFQKTPRPCQCAEMSAQSRFHHPLSGRRHRAALMVRTLRRTEQQGVLA
jgi:hypothetical protein